MQIRGGDKRDGSPFYSLNILFTVKPVSRESYLSDVPFKAFKYKWDIYDFVFSTYSP